MKDDFWGCLEKLVSDSRIVIDRPKDSHHPNYPDVSYPLDYGYLEGTTSCDHAGIDVWSGVSGSQRLSAVILTVDLIKRDSEIIILLGCLEQETQTIITFTKMNNMPALLY